MARTALASIITQVRDLINDPAGAGQVFTDDQIQLSLDRYRQDVRYLRLEPAATITPSATSYLDYYAPGAYKPWEGSPTLVDGGYNALTPDTSDLDNGHWTFASSQSPPVYIVGIVHDLYSAAADLLEKWASKVALQFDFSADGGNYSMSQKQAQLMALARQYRANGKPQKVEVYAG